MSTSLDSLDAAKLSILHKSCFSDGWSEETFTAFLQEVTTCGFKVLGENGDIIGFILARQIGDEAEILTMAVHPNHQNRGLGLKLVEALQDFLSTGGCINLHLEVAVNNLPALALYCRAGFQKTGLRPAYYTSPQSEPVSAHMMRWKALK